MGLQAGAGLRFVRGAGRGGAAAVPTAECAWMDSKGVAPESLRHPRDDREPSVSMPTMRFRDAVATELERRRCGQPRYSLRRFARTLGVHHSTMSRLLRTRRPVPAPTLLAVARGLRMSPAEITEFRAQEDAVAVID